MSDSKRSGVTTEDLVQVALDAAGFDELTADSEIHVPGCGIERVFVGMDVGTAELLLARELGYDCVVAHHPVGGHARGRAHRVFERHADMLREAGLAAEEADRAVQKRSLALRLAGHTYNHSQVPVIAQELGMPLISLHGPCDEAGRARMQEAVDDELTDNPSATLDDVARSLLVYPEFRSSYAAPWVAVGDPADAAGETVVAHGALSNGGAEVAEAYYSAGVDTVMYIHIDPASLRQLREAGRGNLIISGHMASDWLGINFIADQWAQTLGVEAFRTTELGQNSPVSTGLQPNS